LDGPQSRCGRRGGQKILVPSGNRISAVQPVACRYTDLAISGQKNIKNVFNFWGLVFGIFDFFFNTDIFFQKFGGLLSPVGAHSLPLEIYAKF
jgi:hypothetical protein